MNESKKQNHIEIYEATVSVKSADAYSKMAKGLNALNTSRGGENGFPGFAFEEMHAADARIKGHSCNVVNNNGAVDLMIDGRPTQLKMGYKTGMPKLGDGCETVIVDKGNSQLMNKVKNAGYQVEESAISSTEAKTLSDTMRLESKITHQSSAPITGTLGSAHIAGKTAAGLTAKVGLPFQAGANLCDVVTGDKSVEDAVADTVVDGAVAVGSAYLGTAALTTATTTAGSAAIAAAGTIGAATTAAVATVAAAPVLPIVAVATGLGFAGRALSKLFD